MRRYFKSGFTLIELIVSIGLFLIAIFLGLGAIANLYNANNKSQTSSSVVNNINYAIEDMSRVIRFSTTYHCGTSGTLSSPNDCVSGDISLAVTNSVGTTIYRFANSRIETSIDSGVTYKPITGSDVTIQYAKFYVSNSQLGDRYQPYVILVIKGYSGNRPSTQTSFDLETWVSQRPLNI